MPHAYQPSGSCDEAARKIAEAAAHRRAAREAWNEMERASLERAADTSETYAHKAELAHRMGKCSCFVRALVEAEQMDRAFGPRYKW